jgi:glycosyltransferase involved in cell wall biosynthesis
MPDALRKADIFCLPTYYREGVPKVLIEAAASGLPIVTSDIAGCKDVVEDGFSGILVPPRDLHALKRALTRLINDNEFRRLTGERSRAIAEQRFSLVTYVDNLFKIYDALLASDSARGVLRRSKHWPN